MDFLKSLSGPEMAICGVFAYAVAVALGAFIQVRFSSRHWNKYPGAEAEMPRLDDELSRQEGRL